MVLTQIPHGTQKENEENGEKNKKHVFPQKTQKKIQKYRQKRPFLFLRFLFPSLPRAPISPIQKRSSDLESAASSLGFCLLFIFFFFGFCIFWFFFFWFCLLFLWKDLQNTRLVPFGGLVVATVTESFLRKQTYLNGVLPTRSTLLTIKIIKNLVFGT